MNISEYMDWESLFEERMDEDEDVPVLGTGPAPVLRAAPAPVLEEEHEEDVPSLEALAIVSAPRLVQGPGPTPGLRAAPAPVLLTSLTPVQGPGPAPGLGAAPAPVLGVENEEDVPSLEAPATVSAPPLVQGSGPTPGLEAASAPVIGEEDKRDMNDAEQPKTPLCIVRLDDGLTHVYIPCGHLCVCASCTDWEVHIC